jgi:hypothetical protein
MDKVWRRAIVGLVLATALGAFAQERFVEIKLNAKCYADVDEAGHPTKLKVSAYVIDERSWQAYGRDIYEISRLTEAGETKAAGRAEIVKQEHLYVVEEEVRSRGSTGAEAMTRIWVEVVRVKFGWVYRRAER